MWAFGQAERTKAEKSKDPAVANQSETIKKTLTGGGNPHHDPLLCWCFEENQKYINSLTLPHDLSQSTSCNLAC